MTGMSSVSRPRSRSAALLVLIAAFEAFMRIVECTLTDGIRSFSTAFDPAQFEQEHADVHVMAVDDHEGATAQCSLWWSRVPTLPDQRLGVVGHYRAANDRAAQLLLIAACERLRGAGCTCAIGPMDGNTWRRYRFVTDAGTEPAFFLEPQNPPEWPQQFVLAGFSPIGSYFSALDPDLSQQQGRLNGAEARLRSLGVVLHSLRAGEVEDYLPRMYRVGCVAFRNNFLYTQLPQDDFMGQYGKILCFLRPELLIVAEQQRELVGFLLAVPDVLRQRRDAPMDTFIIKTVAVLPRRELGGLGTLLVGRARQIGREVGFQRCIGALMHERNGLVRNISAAYGKPMRRYTLWAKDLSA
jgi:GNAT superfamily N-acetyltransferase